MFKGNNFACVFVGMSKKKENRTFYLVKNWWMSIGTQTMECYFPSFCLHNFFLDIFFVFTIRM